MPCGAERPGEAQNLPGVHAVVTGLPGGQKAVGTHCWSVADDEPATQKKPPVHSAVGCARPGVAQNEPAVHRSPTAISVRGHMRPIGHASGAPTVPPAGPGKKAAGMHARDTEMDGRVSR